MPVKHATTVMFSPDGHPDFQGTRTNVTLTQMERPDVFALVWSADTNG
jgi:hypothetical protein